VRPKASTVLLVASAACFAPAALHGALASAAGTLLEMMPFVLVSALVSRFGSARWALALIGCGCGRVPGGLSLPATALCWLAFGPAVALARLLAAIALSRRTREKACRREGPLDELAAMAPFALAGGLASGWLGEHAATLASAGPVAAFAAGLTLGVLSPCAAGSVALAAGLRVVAPSAAAGILCSAGIARLGVPAVVAGPQLWSSGRLVLAALAFACALAAARHGSGLVHPRLVLPLGCTAAAAVLLAVRGAPRRAPGLPAALVLAALLLGSPEPRYMATETTLEGAFPGERVAFTGKALRAGETTTLVRFAITCCRADAAPVALRLDRPLDVADGTWVEAVGVMVTAPRGPALHATRTRAVGRPSDPFVYR
jgi:hypothetical protein